MTRVIADRFVDPSDLTWFENNFNRTMEEMLGPEIASYAANETFFVDFMRFVCLASFLYPIYFVSICLQFTILAIYG